MSFFQKVYGIVRKIPKGHVTTYGAIAETLGTQDARKIGWALHQNPDHATPCHRVVARDGRLAPAYAFGGPKEQKNALLLEGVTFKDDNHVDLVKHFWQPD